MICSVTRALDVLKVLGHRGSASMSAIATQLDLPRPTVARLLLTLKRRGYVQQLTPRGDYWITSKMQDLGSESAEMSKFMMFAPKIADEVTEQVLWPAAIAQRSGDAMVVQYSTLHKSPYSHKRTTIGQELPLWSSAHGKAWLAHIPVEDRPNAPQLDDISGENRDQLLANLDRVGQVGFATRSLGRDPLTNSLAVPVFHMGYVIATLGITFFSRVVGPTKLQALAKVLKAASAEIAGKIAIATTAEIASGKGDVRLPDRHALR